MEVAMELVLYGISILMSLIGSVVLARLYVWPRVRTLDRDRAVSWLVAPHLIRFVGLSFLIPGVVSPRLPAEFAVPAAYGDLIADTLAVLSVLALASRARWAIPAVWVFNVWGASDLLFAFYQGVLLRIEPGSMGAAFYIPTVIVPPLLVTHALIFGLLLKPSRS